MDEGEARREEREELGLRTHLFRVRGHAMPPIQLQRGSRAWEAAASADDAEVCAIADQELWSSDDDAEEGKGREGVGRAIEPLKA